MFWRPYFIILSDQTLARLGVDNIISTFKKHDKTTCLDRCDMRLRTFADLFNIAIVFSHFCQYSVHIFPIKMLRSAARILKFD